MRVVNLTPHPVTIIGSDNMKITIKNEPVPARAIQDITHHMMSLPLSDNITLDVRLHESTGTKLVGLPEPKEGVIYIVSTLVAQLARRQDLIAPLTDHTAERDEGENIIGVRGFRRFV